MLIYETKNFQIYFGDATDGIYKQLHASPTKEKLANLEPYKSICAKLGITRLSLVNQVHGIDGVQVTHGDFSFDQDGDYLITNQNNTGIGVLSADCVPLILYDAKNNAIAVVHAGWKGAVAGIALKAFEHMRKAWSCDSRHMQVFIGPSANPCCYEVQEDFIHNIPPHFIDTLFNQKEGKWYFDTVQLIELQLKQAGIGPACINKQYNFCTICDNRFFSRRRNSACSGRQITVAHIFL